MLGGADPTRIAQGHLAREHVVEESTNLFGAAHVRSAKPELALAKSVLPSSKSLARHL
jgi:hypothetical protein